MIETIAYILTGLGFYFMGMSGIRANLQRVPGRQFREYIGRATKVPVLAGISGFLMGFVTQTSIGVSVILAGLISRGIATIPQALPVVAWSNFGLVILAYLSKLPIFIVALFLVGFSSLYMQFFAKGRLRPVFEPLYALGLLIVGIGLMKKNCPALAGYPDIAWALTFISGSNILAFIFGAITRAAIQSTSTIVVLGQILCEARIFTGEQALMVLFGTALGTGLAAYFLTSHFQGVMRQITIFEALINAAAGATMISLFYIEKLTHLQILQGVLGSVSEGATETHLTSYFLVQQALCVIFTYATIPWMPGWLERIAPTTVEQDLSRPRFINDAAVQDFETGLSLAEREWANLVQRLPDYLQRLRIEETEKAIAEPVVLHNASQALKIELESFLAALSDRPNKSHSASVALLQLQDRLSLFGEIENGVWQVVQALHGAPPSGALRSLENNVIEALDALLRTSIDAISGGKEDVEMLNLITANPGDTMDGLRRNYMNEEQSMGHEERIILLAMLSQYERIVWTVHQLSRSLEAMRN